MKRLKHKRAVIGHPSVCSSVEFAKRLDEPVNSFYWGDSNIFRIRISSPLYMSLNSGLLGPLLRSLL